MNFAIENNRQTGVLELPVKQKHKQLLPQSKYLVPSLDARS